MWCIFAKIRHTGEQNKHCVALSPESKKFSYWQPMELKVFSIFKASFCHNHFSIKMVLANRSFWISRFNFWRNHSSSDNSTLEFWFKEIKLHALKTFFRNCNVYYFTTFAFLCFFRLLLFETSSGLQHGNKHNGTNFWYHGYNGKKSKKTGLW